MTDVEDMAPGDEVPAAEDVCPRCEGEGVVEDDDGEEICPQCDGSGRRVGER